VVRPYLLKAYKRLTAAISRVFLLIYKRLIRWLLGINPFALSDQRLSPEVEFFLQVKMAFALSLQAVIDSEASLFVTSRRQDLD